MKLRPKTTGLTLIEVLIAMVILSIALLAGSTMIIASHTATLKGDLYTIASKAAADAIAGYEASGYSSLSDGTTGPALYTAAAGEEQVPPGVKMWVTTTIGPIGPPVFPSSATNIKEVDVNVTWDSGSSAYANLAGQVKTSTLISAQ